MKHLSSRDPGLFKYLFTAPPPSLSAPRAAHLAGFQSLSVASSDLVRLRFSWCDGRGRKWWWWETRVASPTKRERNAPWSGSWQVEGRQDGHSHSCGTKRVGAGHPPCAGKCSRSPPARGTACTWLRDNTHLVSVNTRLVTVNTRLLTVNTHHTPGSVNTKSMSRSCVRREQSIRISPAAGFKSSGLAPPGISRLHGGGPSDTRGCRKRLSCRLTDVCTRAGGTWARSKESSQGSSKRTRVVDSLLAHDACDEPYASKRVPCMWWRRWWGA